MRKYALLSGYLPSFEYSGFSKQLYNQQNILTIIYFALKKARLLSDDNFDIKYASRTDRGVGALYQILTIKSENPPIITEINSYLPKSIRIYGYSLVPENFDPRIDAALRIYSYFIYHELDLSKTRETLDILTGRHDFASFSKLDPEKPQNTIRSLKFAEIISHQDNVHQIRFGAKSFLWQQVRRMVNHIIDVSNGNCTTEVTLKLLEGKNQHPKPSPASPEYLILEKIIYNNLQLIYNTKIITNFQKDIINLYQNYRIKSELTRYLIEQMKGYIN